MDPIRVFLVDDHPLIREGMRRLFASESCIVVTGEADSGEEALEKIDETSVDVVLMDIRLQGIDGIETTRRLRAQCPDLKVIVVSSFGREYLAQAIEAGAAGYVLKTATQLDIVQAVIQAQCGQYPLDPSLVTGLVGQLAEILKTPRGLGLSSRQIEILRLISDGVPSKVITTTLAISAATLSRQLRSVFNVLGVDNRSHAVAEAQRRNFI